MALKKEQSQFLEWAAKYGWSFERFRKTGHMLLRHESGVTFTASSTPSDWRGRKNEKAQMLQLVKAREEKPAAAKYKHRRGGGYISTYPTPATPDAPWLVAAQEIEAIDRRLLQVNPRSREARDLALKRLARVAVLERCYQPVPPLPKVFG